jgi:hypothetical protein
MNEEIAYETYKMMEPPIYQNHRDIIKLGNSKPCFFRTIQLNERK